MMVIVSCINCDCYECSRRNPGDEPLRKLERHIDHDDIVGRLRIIHARSQRGLDSAPLAIPMIVSAAANSDGDYLDSEEIEPINLWEFVNEVECVLKVMEEPLRPAADQGSVFPWTISTVELESAQAKQARYRRLGYDPRWDQERAPVWHDRFPLNFARLWHEEHQPRGFLGSSATDLDWLQTAWKDVIERHVSRDDIAGRMRVIHARSQRGLDAAPFSIPLIVTVATDLHTTALIDEEIEPNNLWEFVNQVEHALKVMEKRGAIFPWTISTIEQHGQEQFPAPLWYSSFPINFGEASRNWHKKHSPTPWVGSPASDLDWLEIEWKDAVRQLSEGEENRRNPDCPGYNIYQNLRDDRQIRVPHGSIVNIGLRPLDFADDFILPRADWQRLACSICGL